MKHKLLVIAGMVAVACSLAGTAGAQDGNEAVASRLGSRLKLHDMVAVVLDDGSTQVGTMQGVSSGELTLLVDSAPRAFALESIREVRKKGDSIRNGTITGLLIGLGGSVALGVYTGALCANEGGRNCPEIVVKSWVTPAALGAMLGSLFDAAHVGTTRVFSRERRVSVAPIFGRDTYGAALSVQFR